MLYTIGHTEEYTRAIEQHSEAVYKEVGGYAFRTFVDAKRFIREYEKQDWFVWAIDANWDEDAEIRGEEDGTWNYWGYLTRDAYIIQQVETSFYKIGDRVQVDMKKLTSNGRLVGYSLEDGSLSESLTDIALQIFGQVENDPICTVVDKSEGDLIFTIQYEGGQKIGLTENFFVQVVKD